LRLNCAAQAARFPANNLDMAAFWFFYAGQFSNVLCKNAKSGKNRCEGSRRAGVCAGRQLLPYAFKMLLNRVAGMKMKNPANGRAGWKNALKGQMQGRPNQT
jgi:hypothetical protein